jgi:hypothetical protein
VAALRHPDDEPLVFEPRLGMLDGEADDIGDVDLVRDQIGPRGPCRAADREEREHDPERPPNPAALALRTPEVASGDHDGLGRIRTRRAGRRDVGVGDHGDLRHERRERRRRGQRTRLGLQIAPRFGRRLGTKLALLLGHRGHPAVERRRHRPVRRRWSRHRLVDVLVRDRHRGLAGEGEPARQQLERDDPQRVQVGAGVGGLALELLGRQVLHGPDHVAGLGDLRVGERSSEPEVRDLDDAVARHHQVLRLHVPMHDALAVRVLEGRERLLEDVGRLRRREDALGVQDLADREPGDVLHHHVVDPVDASPVVDGHDVLVVEVGGGACLPAEAFDEARVAREVPVQDLDRHRAFEHRVAGAVDLAHATRGDTIDDVVATVERVQREREIRASGPLGDGALRDGRLPSLLGRCGRTTWARGRVRADILARGRASSVEPVEERARGRT